jgi:hypothetical protein
MGERCIAVLQKYSKLPHPNNPSWLHVKTNSMKRFYLCMAALLLVGSNTDAQLTTVTITASKDNSIYQESENSNGVGIGLFSGTITAANNGAPRRGLIYFDLSSVPPGSTITDVTLRLYCTRGHSLLSPIRLHRLNASWGEGTSDAGIEFDGAGALPTTGDATWLRRVYNTISWTTPGGDYDPTVSASTTIGTFNLFYTWNASQMAIDVQGWVNAPASNNGWIMIGDEAAFLNAKRFATRESFVEANRPQISVTYIGAVPVTLTQFTAQQSGGNVQLNWQTQQELNNAFFGIEHSTDGIQFLPIGKVNGAGSSTTPKNYGFLHPDVLPGRHFYRLAQTDLDGKVHYSTVVQVMVRKTGTALAISPNPAVGIIKLGDAPYPDNTSYTVMSATGSTLIQGKLQGNSIHIAPLAAGTYLIKLQAPGQSVQYGRFVKQ